MKEVYIVSAVRTPIGSFGGALSTVSATKLGAAAIKEAVAKAGIDPSEVNEVFMGNVISANLGQAPARQAALFAGLPNTVPCTTINKVCASGMKAIMFAAQTIMLGDNHVVVAGGMENMSLIPHYLEGFRTGQKLGNGVLTDGMIKDGLTDVYKQYHMGNAAELCASTLIISRDAEVIPVEIETKKGKVLVNKDEEYTNVQFDKIAGLRPVFVKEGTVTAANASTINDGAAALVLMSKEKADQLGLKPIAKIVGYSDAAHEPEWFTTAPVKAIPKAIAKAGLKAENIDFYEINEAFSVVALAAIKELKLNEAKVNVNGGAVSLGHPLGASGARIIATLINVLKQNNGKYGVAAICNGGGGASAMIIENV